MAHHRHSSGFGHELTKQLLARGDRVVGTDCDTGKVADLRAITMVVPPKQVAELRSSKQQMAQVNRSA